MAHRTSLLFDPDRVVVAYASEKSIRWEFQGVVSRGLELRYEVEDLNYASRRDWTFAVRVPNDWRRGIYISVSPIEIPNRRIWVGLNRRSLQFTKATLGRYRGRAYAKLAVSDVTGEVNRRILTTDDLKTIPLFLAHFRPIGKGRVVPAGKDARSLVSGVDSHDRSRMIRLLLALKAWVLDADYSPRDARAATQRLARRRPKRLRGLNLVFSGRMGLGPREYVSAWLRSLGAEPARKVSSKTDVLIVGSHWMGEDRKKLRAAGRLGVQRLSEAESRRRYLV